MPIGVLALQGDVREHIHLLTELGSAAVEVRTVEQLATCDGLVIPGGESTTISKLLVNFGMLEPVKEFVSSKPVLGTCAGLILLSKEVVGRLPDQQLIGGLPVTVQRNAYGRQIDSFEAEINVESFGSPFHAVFIRAPRIVEADGAVEILAKFGDDIVLAKQKNVLVASFHPELSPDKRIHEMFVKEI